MNENDFERIGQLVAQIVDSRLERIDSRLERIDARLDEIEARLDAMDDRIETFKSEIITEFNHSLGIKFEELVWHFQVAAEGHDALTQRVAKLEERVDNDEAKLGDLSLELLAHRRTPDAHRIDGYQVKETETGFAELRREKVEDPKGAEINRKLGEMRRKYDAVTEEINAYCAEKGVVLPETEYGDVMRESRLYVARYRVEQELKKRREEGMKPE